MICDTEVISEGEGLVPDDRPAEVVSFVPDLRSTLATAPLALQAMLRNFCGDINGLQRFDRGIKRFT